MIAIHLFKSFMALQIWMLFIWCIYLVKKNEVLADVAWSVGIALTSLYHFYALSTSTSFIIPIALCLWSCRLSGFIYWTRLKSNQHDARYELLKKRSPHTSNLHFLINCQFQGILQWLLALPFIFPTANFPLMIAGVFLFILGFGIETLADAQLLNFKKTHPHQLCDQGLWQFSRHPNYLGEILLWLGLAISHCSHILAFISPLTLYIIMTRVTGPLTEEASLTSKGQIYKDYQKSTPMIFPNQALYKSLFSKRSK